MTIKIMTTTDTTSLNSFETIINGYLTARAKSDELFAKTFAKPNKNIHECYKYILGELYQSALKNQEGNMACVPMMDEDIYQMAVHYYDEDNIEIKKCEGARTSVSANVKSNTEIKSMVKKANEKTTTKPTIKTNPLLAQVEKKSTSKAKKPMIEVKPKEEEKKLTNKELRQGADCYSLFGF